MRTISVWSPQQADRRAKVKGTSSIFCCKSQPDMSNSLFVQITSLLQNVRGPDGTPETEAFLNVCRHIIPVIGMLGSKESPIYHNRSLRAEP